MTATLPMPLTDPAKAHTVAAIDVGSNAIRMVIAQIGADGKAETLENLQRAVPLGQDCFPDGHIHPETINLAIEVLRGYQAIMAPYKVDRLRAVATSAVREAVNRDLLIERVYMATGISIEVVTGAEEDRLLYNAVRNAFQPGKLNLDETSLIVELGSGSAELSMFRGGGIIYNGSFPLGTIRLRNAIQSAHRTPQENVELIRRYIGPTLDVIEHSSPLGDVRNFISVGGDVRFAASQAGRGDPDEPRVKTIRRRDFLKLADALGKLTVEEIARQYWLPIQDSEALGAALVVYAEMLNRTAAREIIVPYVSMRDGLILDFIAEQTGQGLDEAERLVYSAAENLGQRYQYDEAHARHVATLSVRLFDLLAAEHRLGRRERRLLRVAALLHDIGNFVSNRSHHKHSEYLIAASDLFGMRPDEKALAGCIARYHRRSIPKPTHTAYMALSRQDRATVSKLAAILRVADALDRSHSHKIQNIDLELTRDEMILKLNTREDLTLERLAMRAKGDLFAEVFGRKVVLQN